VGAARVDLCERPDVAPRRLGDGAPVDERRLLGPREPEAAGCAKATPAASS
jgi:hypothetical protein